MPDIFKALATITAWVMWIVAWVTGFGSAIIGIIGGDLFNPAQPLAMSYPATWAVALAYGIGAVVVMILRKKME